MVGAAGIVVVAPMSAEKFSTHTGFTALTRKQIEWLQKNGWVIPRG